MEHVHECKCTGDEDADEMTFYCQYHECRKTRKLHRLCRRSDGFRQLWNEGRGPGQAGKQLPPVALQGWNLAKALAAFLTDGCKFVAVDEYRRRLEICDECVERTGNRCAKCGCALPIKARGRVFRCPIGKWDV
jgi:hypothetical protein